MYATFEDFLEHQQQQQDAAAPETSVPRRPTPPFPTSGSTTPPPPPAPSQPVSGSVTARRKMSGRTRRRRAGSGGGSSGGSRDDVSSSGGGGGSDSCTPLVATIRSIQESRRGGPPGGVGSSEDMDELFPPGPAHGGTSYRNFPSHLLSPAPPLGGMHPNSVDALSCGGYAGTNSIDSGYKSACPTPDLSDLLYSESLFLRGSPGGMVSPRPRITMGTRMMSRGARVGSDPSYYEDVDPSQAQSLFHRRPSTSPGPRTGPHGNSRPRSASTGSRSSPATLGGSSRRALRSSPHMSSTGSLTSSGMPYSRHSSPGGTYSSPGGGISPASRRLGSPLLPPRSGAGSGTEGSHSSSSQLALLEREIDALLTGTTTGEGRHRYPHSEGSQDVSPSLGCTASQHLSGPEDAMGGSPRPPHPPTRLRGSHPRSQLIVGNCAPRHCGYDSDNTITDDVTDHLSQADDVTSKSDASEESASGGRRWNFLHLWSPSSSRLPPASPKLGTPLGAQHPVVGNKHLCRRSPATKCAPSCTIQGARTGTESIVHRLLDTSDFNNFSSNCLRSDSSSVSSDTTSDTSQGQSSRKGPVSSSRELTRFINGFSRFQSSTPSLHAEHQCQRVNMTKTTSETSTVMCQQTCQGKTIDLQIEGRENKRTLQPSRRPGKICRKGTPYPHPPPMTVEEAASALMFNDDDTRSSSSDSRVPAPSSEGRVPRSSDSDSFVDDLDLDAVTITSSSDLNPCHSTPLSDSNPLYPTSRSFEDLSQIGKKGSRPHLFEGRDWLRSRNCSPTPEELYQYHLYEAILYGKGSSVPPCGAPQIPSPPPLPTRPPNLLPPDHLTSLIDTHKFYRANYCSDISAEGSHLMPTRTGNSVQPPFFRGQLPELGLSDSRNAQHLDRDGTQPSLAGVGTVCEDPACNEVCSMCIGPENGNNSLPHIAMSTFPCSNVQNNNFISNSKNVNKPETSQSRNKIGNLSIPPRVTKLQKLGAVIRKNFLSSDPKPLRVSNDSRKNSDTDGSKPVDACVSSEANRNTGDTTTQCKQPTVTPCSCNMEGCTRQVLLKQCVAQNKRCCIARDLPPVAPRGKDTGGAAQAAARNSGHDHSWPATARLAKINEDSVSPATSASNCITTNNGMSIINEDNIPAKAKITLGIIDPPKLGRNLPDKNPLAGNGAKTVRGNESTNSEQLLKVCNENLQWNRKGNPNKSKEIASPDESRIVNQSVIKSSNIVAGENSSRLDAIGSSPALSNSRCSNEGMKGCPNEGMKGCPNEGMKGCLNEGMKGCLNDGTKVTTTTGSAEFCSISSSNGSRGSSPPPTPPPHAAVFCYDAYADEEDTAVDTDNKDSMSGVPQPPPRTTSVPTSTLATVATKNDSALSNWKDNNSGNHSNSNWKKTEEAVCSPSTKTSPEVAAGVCDQSRRRPLPPLPSRAMRSISTDRSSPGFVPASKGYKIETASPKESKPLSLPGDATVNASTNSNNTFLQGIGRSEVQNSRSNRHQFGLKTASRAALPLPQTSGLPSSTSHGSTCQSHNNQLRPVFHPGRRPPRDPSLPSRMTALRENLPQRLARAPPGQEAARGRYHPPSGDRFSQIDAPNHLASSSSCCYCCCCPSAKCCQDPLCPDLKKEGENGECSSSNNSCGKKPHALASVSSPQAIGRTAFLAESQQPAQASSESATNTDSPVAQSPRSLLLPSKFSTNSSGAPAGSADAGRALAREGHSIKSGSLIQPVDDEYGFNVASYLI